MEHGTKSCSADIARLRELAEQIDCFCEPDLQTLTGWTEQTTEARRKRGNGPPYILVGKHYFYPKKQTVEHFQRRSKGRCNVTAAEVL